MIGEYSGSPSWGLTPGAEVAGYRVEARIGAGGMAVVFRAQDVRLGRVVALKILAPAFAGDREFRERFVREWRAVAAVDHPHIIPVYAAGEADGVLYIAMRYVPSGDLRELLRRDGPLIAERASLLLSAVASALDAGHSAGLVHRDVKLANILIDTSAGIAEHPYLADFGLAKGSGSSAGLTGTGQFIGTLDYAAPEQISGKRAVPQTDQYALACAAFTMLTGVAPFSREEPTAVLWAHMSEPPPLVTPLRPDLPPDINQVLARAMAKIPEERYRTCAEFAEAFRTALGVGTLRFGAYVPTELTPARPASAVSYGRSGAGLNGDTVTSLSPVNSARPGREPDDRQRLTAGIAPPSPTRGRGAGLSGGQAPPWESAPRWSHDGESGTDDGGGPASSGAAADGNVWLPRPSPAGRRKGRRRALFIAAAAAAIVVGGAGGTVLAVHPWLHPPVLRPAGLAVESATASALTIDWAGPASGPLPDKYEILSGGKLIGTVPGTVTRYTDSGLAPDSGYLYAVIAVRGGKQSPISLSLTAQTAIPPLSDARLNWAGDVTYDMKSLVPATPGWDKQPGDSWQDAWVFAPKCTSGPCDVMLSAAYDGTPFTSTLTRSGTTYSGTAELKGYFWCGTQSNSITGTLAVKITIKSGFTQGTQWAAGSFSGTATLYAPADYGCTASTADVAVTS